MRTGTRSLICTALVAAALAATAWGQDGHGSIVGWGQQVVGVNLGQDFAAVAPTSGAHSLGLKADGSIVAWGWNFFGQCNVPSPNTDFGAAAAGGFHSLGLKADGSIVAWGYNKYGQCNVPTPNSGFVGVAAGEEHSLGLKADGSIVAWGANAVRLKGSAPNNEGLQAESAMCDSGRGPGSGTIAMSEAVNGE